MPAPAISCIFDFYIFLVMVLP